MCPNSSGYENWPSILSIPREFNSIYQCRIEDDAVGEKKTQRERERERRDGIIDE
jgi:hypothetical protein